MTLESTAWQDQASCRGTDPNVWFSKQYPKALFRICGSCPVFWHCRVYSLSSRLEYGGSYFPGYWAGLSAKDRRDKEEAQRLLEEALSRIREDAA